MFEKVHNKGFQILALHHAQAILEHDMPDAVEEIENVLLTAEIPALELIRGGGGEGALTQRLRNGLAELGWVKHNFDIKKVVDGIEKESISHEVDHVKHFANGTCAMEIEWNNKDPFFDRDLENYKRLHADGVISVGIIITRGETLQGGMKEIVENFAQKNGVGAINDVLNYYNPTVRQRELIVDRATRYGSFERGWASVFVSDKFGEATTHWKKLEDRVHRGVGNPCPLLLIGLPKDIVSI